MLHVHHRADTQRESNDIVHRGIVAAMSLTLEIRMNKFHASFVLIGALTFAALLPRAGASESGPSALGRWVTQTGNLEVEIAPCGEMLCGTVVRVLANNSMSQPGETMQPVDARPVLGMKILADLTSTGEGEWKGQIYNRENGKTYDCRVKPLSSEQLEVRAYRVLPLFGKTLTWTRTGQTAQ
jgi:uncharacterized protein (DUF2147 family)